MGIWHNTRKKYYARTTFKANTVSKSKNVKERYSRDAKEHFLFHHISCQKHCIWVECQKAKPSRRTAGRTYGIRELKKQRRIRWSSWKSQINKIWFLEARTIFILARLRCIKRATLNCLLLNQVSVCLWKEVHHAPGVCSQEAHRITSKLQWKTCFRR